MGQESSHELVEDSIPPKTLKSRSIESVAELIRDGRAPRIVVLTGAGVSTSAGIPDFRSPKTGLYANLARLNLPYAEAVFDISYFRQNPDPFYALARELYPGKYKPTVAHAFVALLAKKGLLHMLFTQNIDCLERAAGVPAERIVEAHGSFATQRCIECHSAFPDDLMLSAVQDGDVPHCLVPHCNGLVKPDIVFFGEALPDSFRQNVPKIAQADLVVIMGTSLSVQPFASLPNYALEGIPRILINLERVGGLGSRPDDVCILLECDKGVRDLADALSWREELEALWYEVSGRKLDEEDTKATPKTRTKDEVLEDEIETITREVDQTLKISDSHKQYLEKHLSKVTNNRLPQNADGGVSQQPEDRAVFDGPSVDSTQDLKAKREISETNESETPTDRNTQNISSLGQVPAAAESTTIDDGQSKPAPQTLEEPNVEHAVVREVDKNAASSVVDNKKSHL